MRLSSGRSESGKNSGGILYKVFSLFVFAFLMLTAHGAQAVEGPPIIECHPCMECTSYNPTLGCTGSCIRGQYYDECMAGFCSEGYHWVDDRCVPDEVEVCGGEVEDCEDGYVFDEYLCTCLPIIEEEIDCDFGFYFDSTIHDCKLCPAASQCTPPTAGSNNFSGSIADCYIPGNTPCTDNTGLYTMTENCGYKL